MALPDGIHLRLPFSDYLALRDGRSLGSTDKGRLWLRREGWWWASPLAPYQRDEEDAKELLFGQACHAALLEGLHAYESRYAVEPDKRSHPDALFTTAQIEQALRDAGVYPPGASKFRKADWAEAAEVYLPGIEVWDNIIADFDRVVARGRTRISAEADFQIRAMRDIALADPQMAELLGVGSEWPPLAEVTILWTDELGVRHCARLDDMLPPVTIDLKTWGNYLGEPLETAADKHIRKNAYDVQRADYDIARAWAMAAIRRDPGVIHGGTEEEREHLVAIAEWEARTETKPKWAWIFYQKPSSSGAAPVLFPVMERFGGPYHRAGYRKRHAALATYHACMARFGPDKPWGRVEPVHLTDDMGDGVPHLRQDPFARGEPDVPVEGETEYFGDGR